MARRRGFTLIELLLVLVILAILAGAVVLNLGGTSEKAHVTRAKSDIASIKMALSHFEIDNGRFPTSEEGLQALVEAPQGAKNFKQGGYIEGGVVPKDPWGNPYNYQFPAARSKAAYDIWSNGPDGNSGGSDDIGNWE